jgi:hypothetical protein
MVLAGEVLCESLRIGGPEVSRGDILRGEGVVVQISAHSDSETESLRF